jgi:hypothetical protein
MQPEDSKWDDVFITWAKVRAYVTNFCSFFTYHNVNFPDNLQDFSIDENAVTISFPPGCVAPANSAGLAKALSSRRRPHVTAVDLQVRIELGRCGHVSDIVTEQPSGRRRLQTHSCGYARRFSNASGMMLLFPVAISANSGSWCVC